MAKSHGLSESQPVHHATHLQSRPLLAPELPLRFLHPRSTGLITQPSEPKRSVGNVLSVEAGLAAQQIKS